MRCFLSEGVAGMCGSRELIRQHGRAKLRNIISEVLTTVAVLSGLVACLASRLGGLVLQARD